MSALAVSCMVLRWYFQERIAPNALYETYLEPLEVLLPALDGWELSREETGDSSSSHSGVSLSLLPLSKTSQISKSMRLTSAAANISFELLQGACCPLSGLRDQDSSNSAPCTWESVGTRGPRHGLDGGA